MVRQAIEVEDTSNDTFVRATAAASAPTTPSDDDDDNIETEALHRFEPVRSALMRSPDNTAQTQNARPWSFEDAPTTSIGFVDAQARPVSPAGFDQRYELLAVLGTGGMGEVRLCKDRLIGRDVALKVMHDGAKAPADLRERFVREVRIQGQLEHPAIVPVYDLGVDAQGGIVFTMKRIRGMTLDAVLERIAQGDAEVASKYSRRKLLTAFNSVCLAVDFAHRRGVIHRDLKPENIILGDFGEVYVLDWGIAKVTSPADSASGDALELTQDAAYRTALGSLIGTPGYMSPEQACGAIDKLDARTDVYALGAILFEIIAGAPLHTPSFSAQKMLASAIRGVDARPSARGGLRVPPELDAICVRATEMDPADRYPSARALSDAIERFLDGDRDEELRQSLSKRHAEAALDALSRASSGGEDADTARATALREIGSALALDPSNVDALRTMARLLMEVPEKVPPEAVAEIHAASAAARQDAARAGANRSLIWIAFLPLALWMGVRHIPSTAAAIGAILLCAATSWWISRRTAVDLRQGLVLLLLSSATIGLMSALFGPFILVPGLVATNTMFFAMSAGRRSRGVIIAVGVVTIALPYILEVFGVVPPAYRFEGGVLEVLPRATELPALQTMLCLLLTSVSMVVLPALFMGRMRDALATAERRLVLQAWHLRQLVPGGARGALSPKKTLMPTPDAARG